MAYVGQEMKKNVESKIKPLLKKHGLKGTLKVENYSTLVLTLRQGCIDFMGEYNAALKNNCERRGVEFYESEYVSIRYNAEVFSVKIASVLNLLLDTLRTENYYDYSDAMTDYFDCSHYYEINIGEWNKPYKLITEH